MSKKNSSRIKYEQNHPVVSFRISKELYDSLQAAKEKEGLSYTDILKIGLGLTKLTIDKKEVIEQKAFDKGWEKGNDDAMNVYPIYYPCSKCGKEIIVTSAEEKDAIT